MARVYRKRRNISAIRLTDMVKANKRQLILLGAVVALVIIGGAAAVNLAGRQAFGSSFLVTGDTVKIGLRTDIAEFGHMGESGEIEGFDKDFIYEALGRILEGQDKLYEYVPITSQDAGASIKYEKTNICLGLLVEGTARTDGFRVTAPYYTDRVVAVVHGGSRVDKLGNMEGGTVGVLSMAINEEEAKEYLEKNKITTDALRYSDYESAMTDIEHDRVDAVIMPYAIARQFESAGFRILAEPLYSIGYSVMLPTGQTAFTAEMSRVIGEMEWDGTTEALRQKWGV